jgi:hypothetical protein
MPQIIRIKNEKKRPTPPRIFMGFQLDKNDLYNGKPLQHWLNMAEENVISAIVRGINPDKNSLVATVTAERLQGLAMALNPNLYYKLKDQRDACREAVPRVLGQMLGWAPSGGTPYCAAHQAVDRTKKPKSKAKVKIFDSTKKTKARKKRK